MVWLGSEEVAAQFFIYSQEPEEAEETLLANFNQFYGLSEVLVPVFPNSNFREG